MARLKDKYRAEVAPALKQHFQYKNVMEIPRLEKVVINMGLGDCKDNNKAFEMAVANGKLFVANSGGWGTDKTVTVIDTKTLKVENTITVGDNPYDMDVDAQGNIIVLCKGLTEYDAEWNPTVVSNTSIYTINASSLEATVTKQFDHQFASYGGNLLACNGNTVYFIDAGHVPGPAH